MDRIDSKYKTSLDGGTSCPSSHAARSTADSPTQKPKIEAVVEENEGVKKAKKKTKRRKKKPSQNAPSSIDFSCTFETQWGTPRGRCGFRPETRHRAAGRGGGGCYRGTGRMEAVSAPGEGTVPNPCANDLDYDSSAAASDVKLSLATQRHWMTARRAKRVNLARRRGRVAVELSA